MVGRSTLIHVPSSKVWGQLGGLSIPPIADEFDT